MSAINTYYSVIPRMVPANKRSTITITPLFDHCRLKAGVEYRLGCHPAGGYDYQTRQLPHDPIDFTISNCKLTFNFNFESEQEYVVVLSSISDGAEQSDAEFRLYALEPDLFARKAFKGDTHLHTYYSDGKESPAFVAASSRMIGLDFMAITDHRQHAPSLEAIEAMEALDTDMRIFPGEEVHSPENPVHIVNFGGRISVNALFSQDEFTSGVQSIIDTLTDLPSEVDPYTYASCVYCFNKIREGEGLAIFCHPYWFVNHCYDVPEYLIDLLLEKQPWDALEIIGGFFKHQVESNTLAVARYHEERAMGKRLPIVGASDSHGCADADLFGWTYTIVFSETDDLPDLVRNIKDLNSVAVEALPGESIRAYGPFRLVKYAQFLIREIFPEHDKLCQEEGNLMLSAVAGNPTAKDRLKLTKGAVKNLYKNLWGY